MTATATLPTLTTGPSHRGEFRHPVRCDGWPVGYIQRIREPGTTGKMRNVWVAQCSPLAFTRTGVGSVEPHLYAPVPGSNYLPGRHTGPAEAARAAAVAELAAHLVTTNALVLDTP